MKLRVWASIAMLACACTCCNTGGFVDPLPYVFIYEEYNLNSSQLFGLDTDGWVYLDGVGHKGLILFNVGFGEYRAFERLCTFDYEEACALIEVDDSGFFLIDHCCGSTFDWLGNPTGGPATLPLRIYFTRVEGDILIVSSDPF